MSKQLAFKLREKHQAHHSSVILILKTILTRSIVPNERLPRSFCSWFSISCGIGHLYHSKNVQILNLSTIRQDNRAGDLLDPLSILATKLDVHPQLQISFVYFPPTIQHEHVKLGMLLLVSVFICQPTRKTQILVKIYVKNKIIH